MSSLWPVVHAAGITTSAALAWATFAPRCTWWGPLVWRGTDQGPPRVALTFDDGPLRGATDRVLDVLAELGVKAAFFVIGARAEAHPELLRRMHDDGHLIGNHTFDHPAAGFLRGPIFWRKQLARTDSAIERAIGLRPRLFRPPVGFKNPFSARAAGRRHVVVTWTRRAMDGVSTTPGRILRRVVPAARPGEILLLHDGISPQSRRDPSVTLRALAPLILGLRRRGIEPARLDELTGIEPYHSPDDRVMSG